MPIAAAMTPLKELLKLSLTQQQGASNDGIAGAIISGLTTTTPMGMFPPAPSPIPLVPSGAIGSLNVLKNSLSLAQGASNSQIAQIMASAISLCCPTVPPSGLSVLKVMIENTVLTMQQGADNNMIATNLANAIVMYYSACGVI